MDRFSAIVHRLGGWGVTIGTLSLIGIMLLVVSNVIVRFFGGVIAGTYELVTVLIIVTAGFALAYGAIQHGHVYMDTIISKLPPRTRLIILSVMNFISLCTMALMAWAMINVTQENTVLGEATPLLHLPMLPFRCIWIFGLIIFCLAILLDLMKNLKQEVSK